MRVRVFAAILVGLMLFTASAFADSKARIVRLSYLEGNVQLDRGDGNGYIRAFLNMPLIEGASLWTHADGRAEVEFEDGSTARLTPNTIVVFTELRLRSDGSKLSSLTLSDGVAYFTVKHDRDDSFRVFAGDRELQLERSSSFRVVHSARQGPFDLRVAVFKGELRFLQPDGQRVAVKKNETLTLDLGEPDNRYFLARGIVEEAHDYWDREREEDRVILARNQASRGVYYADLYRHGAFITVSGYGELWRPYGVSFSWDPFGHGAWVYYPGYGHIWVSNYVWGWTPYRYGSWVYLQSRGWCWRPARIHHHWNPYPVIVNAPTGYVAPVPPPARSGPIVRVGRRLDPDMPIGDGRVRPLDGPDGTDGEIGIIQDRVHGPRSADARFPRSGRTGEPVSGGARIPDSTGRARDLDSPVGDGRPARSGRVTDSVKPSGGGPREGDIDAHRGDDTPVRVGPSRVTPQDTGAPVSPAAGERSPRPTRLETPDSPVIEDRRPRPTRVETVSPAPAPPAGQTAPPASPTVTDRPSRPSRVDTPPPASPMIQDRGSRPSRVDSPPPQPQPSSPPPQRMSPPPSAPPPAQDSPSRPSRTTIKDQ